ncbi:MAG: tRNA pseudouridine(38-40) synthase TruA [bacterium]
MRNIKLLIEYDGTDLFGWQVQRDRRTVQGELQKALRTLLNRDADVIGAGRTDTGVHALGQVAHFKTDSDLDVDTIYRGLNSLLPGDIVIQEVIEVDSTFHARFDAKSRRYMYRITRRKRAIGRQFTWYVNYPLDVSKMAQATEPLRGRHNFGSFCAAGTEMKDPTCTLFDIHWAEQNGELTLEAEADRFLQHMVRTIVGTLVEVGKGRWEVSTVQEILKAEDRRKAGPTAPAQGLCLVEVKY